MNDPSIPNARRIRHAATTDFLWYLSPILPNTRAPPNLAKRLNDTTPYTASKEYVKSETGKKVLATEFANNASSDKLYPEMNHKKNGIDIDIIRLG